MGNSGEITLPTCRGYTLPKTSIAPENRPSQKEIHLPTTIFQGLWQFQGG